MTDYELIQAMKDKLQEVKNRIKTLDDAFTETANKQNYLCAEMATARSLRHGLIESLEALGVSHDHILETMNRDLTMTESVTGIHVD